jgi:hypothetical protein
MQLSTTPRKKKRLLVCPSAPSKLYRYVTHQSILTSENKKNPKKEMYKPEIANLMFVYHQIYTFINNNMSIYEINKLYDIYSYYSLTKIKNSRGNISKIPDHDINFKEILKFTKTQYGDPSNTRVSSSDFQKYCGMRNSIIKLTDRVNVYNTYVDAINGVKKYPRIILPDDNVPICIIEYKEMRKYCHDYYLYRYPYPYTYPQPYPIDLT